MTVNRLRGARGMSLLELLTAISVVGIASGITVANFERNVSATREGGAARAFAMRVRQTRLEAIQRSAGVALHFTTSPAITSSPTASFRAYVDGNGNGVRTREIASGIDPPLGPVAALDDGLGGVRFARAPDIPAIGDDDDGAAPGGGAGSSGGGAGGSAAGGSADDSRDAIRLGAAGLLSFAATGSGTSGTIYLRGTTSQFAVRIYGPTGRVRLLEWNGHARVWLER
jgi:prepilin-type N-terminal cleavage/methylation domain-containing protein